MIISARLNCLFLINYWQFTFKCDIKNEHYLLGDFGLDVDGICGNLKKTVCQKYIYKWMCVALQTLRTESWSK